VSWHSGAKSTNFQSQFSGKILWALPSHRKPQTLQAGVTLDEGDGAKGKPLLKPRKTSLNHNEKDI